METCRRTKISTQSSKLGISCRSLYASPDDGGCIKIQHNVWRAGLELFLTISYYRPFMGRLDKILITIYGEIVKKMSVATMSR